MKLNLIPAVFCVVTAMSFSGCAKGADPKRPLEKIQTEVASMSVADLETNAVLYAAAIRGEKAKINKIQDQMKKMPIEKLFSDKKMTGEIAEIGRRAEAFFMRYQIYAESFQAKGGDVRKIQIRQGQTTRGESK